MIDTDHNVTTVSVHFNIKKNHFQIDINNITLILRQSKNQLKNHL